MTAVQCLITAAAILLGTLATRFAPFVLLPKNRPVPRLVEYLGGTLPYAAMGLLVVYCLKDVAWLSGTHGAPDFHCAHGGAACLAAQHACQHCGGHRVLYAAGAVCVCVRRAAHLCAAGV